MSVSILNTDSNLSAKTLLAAENADTVTGLKTFDRDPNAPFAVSSGSAVVPNLDADKVDGVDIPGAASDILSDYAEGTFTPTVTGSTSASGQAYSLQTGNYTRVGRQVTAYGQVALSTLGTITGNVQLTLTGIPTPAVASAPVHVINVGGSLSTSVVSLNGILSGSAVTVTLYKRTAAATAESTMVQADLTNATSLLFSVTYYV